MAIFHWFSSFRDIAILWWHCYILIYPFIIVRNIIFSIVRCGCAREVTKSRKETLPFISQCQLYRPKLDWSTEFEIWNIACLHHCWYCLPGSPALFPRLQSILHYSTFSHQCTWIYIVLLYILLLCKSSIFYYPVGVPALFLQPIFPAIFRMDFFLAKVNESTHFKRETKITSWR